MKDDGNLVLTLVNDFTNVLWESKTNGRGERLVMESGGNLVIYDNKNNTIWESNTNGQGEFMQVENNGTLSVYDSNRIKAWSLCTYNPFRIVYFFFN